MRLVVLTVGEIYDSWQNECSAIHLVSVHDEVSASCFGGHLCQLVGLHTLVWVGGFAKISAQLSAEKGVLARQSLCYIRSHTQRMWD